MEDSGAILRQISSFKDMLDQVNEEIEQNVQRTREIELELVKLSETEDSYSMREVQLTKIMMSRVLKLDGLTRVADISKASLEIMERELKFLKKNKFGIEKRLSDKSSVVQIYKEEFVVQCGKFRDDMKSSENDELTLLLSEKGELENQKERLIKKIAALESSTEELIEEILQEIYKSNSALVTEIHNMRSEYMIVLNDISDLRTLIVSINSLEDSHEL